MDCGCNDPHGHGVVPGPITSRCFKPAEPPVKLETIIYEEQLGTDAKGQPYEPKFGKFHNTVVKYLANDAVYVYDANGQYTLIAKHGEVADGEDGYINGDQLFQIKEALEEMDRQLQENIENEATAREEADAKLTEDLENESKAREDKDIELQESIDDLQSDLDKEVEERTQAEGEINQRIDDIINSPDVRYIVDTHADLEAIDKTTVGDKDYARVLQDETHEGASAYYQFDKASNEWSFVGITGPYYTKEEADAKFATSDTLEADYATKAYVDEKLGDVETVLQTLNTGAGV